MVDSADLKSFFNLFCGELVNAILDKGGVVYRINRFEPKDDKPVHESERIDTLEGCIDIDNKTTLLSLYYKIYDVMRKQLI